jgi:4-aminobutyrate aminotransferase-like enzyme
LVTRQPALRGVRNAGLFFGIDLGRSGSTAEARRELALSVVNTLRDDAVLISTTGANEDTLKVRPPLICAAEHVDLFLTKLDRALTKITGQPA